MKKTHKIFCYILFLQINLIAQWYSQPSFTFQNLNSIDFVDENNGWIAGTNGEIWRTSDSGLTWSIQSSGTNYTLNDVFFINDSLGWAVGGQFSLPSQYGKILKTSDGGENWNNLLCPGFMFQAVCFIDENTGWATGFSALDSRSIIVKTTNGGLNWTGQISTPNGLLMVFLNIFFIDQNIGWVVGNSWANEGVIYKTTNGGLNWNWIETEINSELHSIFFVDQNTGWVAGFDNIYKSNDGGINWINQISGINSSFYSIYFLNEDTGWVSGNNIILKTSDGGSNWLSQVSDANSQLYSIDFIDSNQGWVVGTNGKIFKTTNSGTTFIDEELTSREIFSLSQNFPNPFNPSTIISYQLPKAGNVTLKVFDVLGNEIATIVNEEKSAGSYEIEFNPASSIKNPASGIYFYQLKAGEFVDTKKMMFLK